MMSPEPVSSASASRRKASRGGGGGSGNGDVANAACNVKVCVRCRPRNEEEKKQGSKNVISCSKQKAEVSVVEKHKKNERQTTFRFDHVFDEKTSQEMLFEEQVKPMVLEVLQGFNCTVFAYGQTGTGKTFTMEGGDSEATRGIIPRAVYEVFAQLQHVKEYSVKISFLELYNEELSDLLSDDAEKRLRIFGNDTGVTVSNLEETHVASANDVFSALEVGFGKRRQAATLLNEQSSRSHSIFTMTIYSKASNDVGENVIKTGKLHLVDLAGSECIGRSGAVEKRAKEASMINKSLLTLGRVINALVERHSYVPYRDSKLTRLLKESLGGSAKTLIIATISPAANCMDETISTLSYAHRAKNIQNKPTVNEKITHKTYMNELLRQIQLLKRENDVLRNKNGIILPPEQFEDMEKTLKANKLRLEELVDELAAKHVEYVEVEALFATTKTDLACTREQKTAVEAELRTTYECLEGTKVALAATETRLAEQRYVVRAYHRTEKVIAAQATELKGTLETVLQDKDALHAKISRKAEVEEHNSSAMGAFSGNMHGLLTAMQGCVDEYATDQDGARARVHALVDSFHIQQQQHTTTMLSSVRDLNDSVTLQLAALKEQVAMHGTRTAEAAARHSSGVAELTTTTTTALDAFAVTHAAQVRHMMDAVATQQQQWSAFRAYVDDTMAQADLARAEFVSHNATALADMTKMVAEHGTAHTQQLGATSDSVRSFEGTYRQQSEVAMTSLMAGVQGLMAQFAAQQQAQVSEQVASVCASLATSVADTDAHVQAYSARAQAHDGDNSAWATEQHHVHTDDACPAVAAYDATFATSVHTVTTALEQQQDAYTAHVADVAAQLSATATYVDTEIVGTHRESTDTHVTACTCAVDVLVADTVTASESFGDAHAHLCTVVDTAHADVTTAVCEYNNTTHRMRDEHDERATSVHGALTHFVDEAIRTDVPTGQTPQKRSFEYPSQFARTNEQKALIEAFHSGVTIPEDDDVDNDDHDDGGDDDSEAVVADVVDCGEEENEVVDAVDGAAVVAEVEEEEVVVAAEADGAVNDENVPPHDTDVTTGATTSAVTTRTRAKKKGGKSSKLGVLYKHMHTRVPSDVTNNNPSLVARRGRAKSLLAPPSIEQ